MHIVAKYEIFVITKIPGFLRILAILILEIPGFHNSRNPGFPEILNSRNITLLILHYQISAAPKALWLFSYLSGGFHLKKTPPCIRMANRLAVISRF